LLLFSSFLCFFRFSFFSTFAEISSHCYSNAERSNLSSCFRRNNKSLRSSQKFDIEKNEFSTYINMVNMCPTNDFKKKLFVLLIVWPLFCLLFYENFMIHF
jgi:hypothetical protein